MLKSARAGSRKNLAIFKENFAAILETVIRGLYLLATVNGPPDKRAEQELQLPPRPDHNADARGQRHG
jgi:hypothetical protein